MKVLFQNPEGGLSVVVPTGATPVEDVCHKCIPVGTPYLIVEDDAIPTLIVTGKQNFHSDYRIIETK